MVEILFQVKWISYRTRMLGYILLQVVNAMRYIGLDYDIQAIDITDPNPISLLMLSVYLYQKLPLYLPKSTVTFTGSLHQTVQRQVNQPIGSQINYY